MTTGFILAPSNLGRYKHLYCPLCLGLGPAQLGAKARSLFAACVWSGLEKKQRIAEEISFFHFCLFAWFFLILGWAGVSCITGLVKKRHFSSAAFDQTLLERSSTPPSLCTSQNDAIFRKYFLKLHVFANHGVTQPCPALTASANRAGRICRCREAHSLPGFLSSLPCPDHLFRRVQGAESIRAKSIC